MKNLGKMGGTKMGGHVLSELQGSDNNFLIEYKDKAFNRFEVETPEGAKNKTDQEYIGASNDSYAAQEMETGVNAFNFMPNRTKIGSGGKVTLSNLSNSFVLIHELMHAYDSNFGTLDNRSVTMSNGDKQEIREIRAVYKTNMIRGELGIKYRPEYGGANMLNASKQPINYTNPSIKRLAPR